ncbi:hypothetical protein NJH77_25930 [Serratia fonticola]|uniref:hypothetical protein n=1 Tax=Serratia fonticola TaxID=47917 RepID=UPI002097A70D|nr:hypothetical protein [Serratia fonticola]MCO7512685.1 hypothetical protein [Serratia fonticola]
MKMKFVNQFGEFFLKKLVFSSFTHRRQRLIEHFVQMAEPQFNRVEMPEPFIGGIVLRTSAMIDLRSYHKSFAGMDQGVTRLITLAYYDDLGIR